MNPVNPTATGSSAPEEHPAGAAGAPAEVRLPEQLGAAGEELLRKQMEARLERLALTDELTGLNNRRGFLLHAEQTLKVVHRVRSHGWLIYVSLDGVKETNERLGREVGDRLIRSAAKVLRESFRDSDILGRIGGDEFAVFATGATTPAPEVEERLARNIEHYNCCFPDGPALAMHIGVVRCDPHATESLEESIYQADAAMYIEKRRRRDRQRYGLPD
jgi:diguanylate cyclase (GGDEF)-like protein